MLKTTDLIGLPIVTEAGEEALGRCGDLLIDLEAGALRATAVVADEASPVAEPFAALPAENCGISSDTITVRMTPQMRAAFDTRRKERVAEPPVALGLLPPLMIGPLGNTLAPALMGALLNDASGAGMAHPSGARPAKAEEKEPGLWLRGLATLPVFGERGELGRIIDFDMDPATQVLATMTIEGSSGERWTLPTGQVRHVTEDKSSVVVQTGDARPWFPA